MSAATTFDPMNGDPLAARKSTFIPERQSVIPHWQKPIKDYTVQVKRNGEPQGFTIGDVIPERRWAIDPESGELMSQNDFAAKYREWYEEHFFVRGQPADECRTLPLVHKFVRLTLDEAGNVVPMGYDPSKRPAVTREQLERKLANARTMEANAEAAAAVGTTAQERAEAQDGAKKLAQVEMLTQLFAEGVIDATTYAAKTQEALGSTAVAAREEAVEAEPVADEFRSACGKVSKSAAGQAAHERRCDVCAKTAAMEAEAAE